MDKIWYRNPTKSEKRQKSNAKQMGGEKEFLVRVSLLYSCY